MSTTTTNRPTTTKDHHRKNPSKRKKRDPSISFIIFLQQQQQQVENQKRIAFNLGTSIFYPPYSNKPLNIEPRSSQSKSRVKSPYLSRAIVLRINEATSSSWNNRDDIPLRLTSFQLVPRRFRSHRNGVWRRSI